MGFDSLQYVRTLHERWDKDNSSVAVEMRCLWSERLEAVRAMIGGRYGDGGEFEVPWVLSTGTMGVHCISVDIDPQGYDDGDYYCARLTANFGVEKLIDLNHNVFDVRVEIAAEGIELKEKKLIWGSTADGSDEDYGTELTSEDSHPYIVFPYLEVSFRQRYMPQLNLNTIAEKMGKINDGDCPMGDSTFPAGQVRFLGAHESYQTNTLDTGMPLFERELKFGVRVNDGLGWNAIWRPEIAKFQEVFKEGFSPEYEYTNVEELFW